MKGFTPPSTLILALALLLGVVSAAAGAMAMTALARPADYKDRMSAVQASIDYAEQVRGTPGAAAYVERAVCEQPLVPAAEGLQRGLAARAGEAGVTIGALQVAPGAGPGPRSKLAPIDVSFAAEGTYEGAVRMVSLLDAVRPAVFVDSLELRRRAGGASLKVTGRAFCWTSVPR